MINTVYAILYSRHTDLATISACTTSSSGSNKSEYLRAMH